MKSHTDTINFDSTQRLVVLLSFKLFKFNKRGLRGFAGRNHPLRSRSKVGFLLSSPVHVDLASVWCLGLVNERLNIGRVNLALVKAAGVLINGIEGRVSKKHLSTRFKFVFFD